MAIIRDRTLAELTSGQYDLNFPSVGVPIDSPSVLVFYLGDGHRALGSGGGSSTTALSQLTDVQLNSLQTGQFLVRAAEHWTNVSYTLDSFSPGSLGTTGQILTIDGSGAPSWSNPYIGSFSLDSLTDVDMTGFSSGVQNVLVNNPGSSTFTPASLSALTAKSFLNLTDTPGTYGSPGQVVVVNGSGNGLVFAAPASGATTLLQLNDTPVAYGAAGQALVVNELGTGTVWASVGGGGSTTFLGLNDTPNAFTGAGKKLLAVNQAANAVEFITNSLMNHIDMAAGTPEQDQGIVYDDNALGAGVPGFKLQEMLRINLSNNPYSNGRTLISNGNDYVDTPVSLLQPGITTGDLWYYDSTLGSAVRLAAGTSGHILMTNGPGLAPTFVDPASVVTPTAIAFTDLTDAPATLGAANQYVRMNGAGTALIFGDLPAYGPTTGAGITAAAGLLPAAPTGFPQAVMRGGGWSLSEIPPYQPSIYYQGQARVVMERAIWSRLVAGTGGATWNDAEKVNWVRLIGLTLGTKVHPAGDVTMLADDQAYVHFITPNGSGADRFTVGRISTTLHIATEVEIHNLGPNEATLLIDAADVLEGSNRLPVGHTSRFKVRNTNTWVRMDALSIEQTQTEEKVGTYTAKVNEVVLVNSTLAPRSVVMPATAAKDDKVTVIDSRGTSSSNNITVDFVSAAALLNGTSENFILNDDGAFASFLFVGGLIGWVRIA